MMDKCLIHDSVSQLSQTSKATKTYLQVETHGFLAEWYSYSRFEKEMINGGGSWKMQTL